MKLRALALFPWIFAALVIVVVEWLGEGEALAGFLIGQRLLVRVLAIAGCAYAASVFSRGDHLRRAWLWLAVSTILVLARDLLRYIPALAAWTDSGVFGATLVRGLGVASNLFLLLGVFELARSWRKASMTLPGGRAGLITVTVVATALALAVAGPSALANARALGAGDGTAIVALASSVVDILALCLLSPLFLTALSMRGGLFVWPWALMTASLFSWVLYDAAELWREALSFQGVPLSEIFRGLAQNLQFSAGVAQGIVVTSAVRGLRQPAGTGAVAGLGLQDP